MIWKGFGGAMMTLFVLPLAIFFGLVGIFYGIITVADLFKAVPFVDRWPSGTP